MMIGIKIKLILIRKKKIKWIRIIIKKVSKETNSSNKQNKNYTYEDYFNKLKELGLYSNRF